jgi:hypothetical protein
MRRSSFNLHSRVLGGLVARVDSAGGGGFAQLPLMQGWLPAVVGESSVSHVAALVALNNVSTELQNLKAATDERTPALRVEKVAGPKTLTLGHVPAPPIGDAPVRVTIAFPALAETGGRSRRADLSRRDIQVTGSGDQP